MTGAIALPARILGTASVLPGRAVETSEVLALLGRRDTGGRYEQKTGIFRRHWAEPGALMAPLAAEAVRLALENAGMAAKDLKRIILVRSCSGDLRRGAPRRGHRGELLRQRRDVAGRACSSTSAPSG